MDKDEYILLDTNSLGYFLNQEPLELSVVRLCWCFLQQIIVRFVGENTIAVRLSREKALPCLIAVRIVDKKWTWMRQGSAFSLQFR